MSLTIFKAEPIIINPYDYNKNKAYDDTIVYVKAFLVINNLPHPRFTIHNSLGSYGDYGYGLIRINRERCVEPVKVPFRKWSFTGYNADRTVSGVICHEVGHYIHFNNRYTGLWTQRFSDKIIQSPKNRVSSYEPEPSESIAESVRLFILNPDLLRVISYRRWSLLQELGLKPATDKKWQEILKYADKKFHRAIENKQKNNK